ncbi:hypothetical protein LCGC14_1773880 [marine sediment metagenome]|uniref:Uncharacterized protein n=1 Tax=marine sediment metagenome TaxID=412755 RepID=A0A0F9GXD3_9ZZZZ
MESLYDILVYVFVLVGITITICSYFINRFQKYSVQRGILMFIISFVYLFNILFSSQMGNITIKIANIQLVVNFFGVFSLFIIISILYAAKALFDLIDFKINKTRYDRILRREQTTKIKQAKLKTKLKEESEEKLIECTQCGYACKMSWKKCPICETKI